MSETMVDHAEPAFAHSARTRLLQSVANLRYGGTIQMGSGIRNAANLPEAEFLAVITDWLDMYGKVIAGVSDTTTEMAAELNELRQQRKCVRDFLGLPAAIGDR